MAWNMPFSAQGLGLNYVNTAAEKITVQLELADAFWRLKVSDGKNTWQQSTLLPLHHPLDSRAVERVHLTQDSNGFSVWATYPVRDLLEQIQFSFEHPSETVDKHCPLQLTQFRREQRYAPESEKAGQVRSRIVVDYKSGIARISNIEGQPSGVPSLPVRLLPQDLNFCSLPSALEFAPNLDLPKVR